MGNLLLFIILGGIAGWLASIVMKTDSSMGVVANVVVGVLGALIGGFVFTALGGQGVTGFNFYSLLVALVGSIILLWLVKIFRRA
ncbi:MAG: GlsB/YeaQ/YmgE family stress response membrane protein [Candidatus Chaera renei]|uniref:GlsB/YeaQ/YmgE family stress response membrane protein n=1 Tax=Candidatus Chaera renei TaxID=2506947 RepID=A0A4Q0AIG7_9BACT|nr:MAG: GlsB/YeaQ/YmgE family stress response membrane protein [Candidatus Chaera renei]